MEGLPSLDIRFQLHGPNGRVVVAGEIVGVDIERLPLASGVGAPSVVFLEGQHVALVADGLHVVFVAVGRLEQRTLWAEQK